MEREKAITLGIIAAVLVAAAILSMFISNGQSSNFCASQFTAQQKYTCMESLAISSNNSTICSSLSGVYKDGCYSQIAVKENSTSLCGAISNETAKAVCTTQIANNKRSYASCLQLSQPYVDNCLYLIGTGYKNASACTSIANASLSNSCLYSIDYSNALYYKNQSYCNAIGNGTYAQSLAMLNSTQGQNTSSTTENLAIIVYYYNLYYGLQISPKDICYYSLAYQSNDSKYCGSISNSSLSTLCKNSYVRNTSLNSTSYYGILSKLCSSSGQVSCPYTTFLSAISTKNVTKCKSLNSSESEACFASLASYYSNSSYCQYLSNATLNGACVSSIIYHNSTNTTS